MVFVLKNDKNSRPGFSSKRYGFTAVEMAMVVLIMAILTVVGFDTISTFEANQRADRAAREALASFRIARNIAVTTGKNARVVMGTWASSTITTDNHTFTVIWNSNGDGTTYVTYTSGLTASGNWVLDMSTNRELSGTTRAVTGTTGSYANYFQYTALGNCGQTGTITFTYGSKTKTLVVANVGDPQIQ